MSGQTYFGSLWIGWGIFNVVEGLIDHEIVRVHHVYQNAPHTFLLWDMVFLASGFLFLILGSFFVRQAPAAVPRRS